MSPSPYRRRAEPRSCSSGRRGPTPLSVWPLDAPGAHVAGRVPAGEARDLDDVAGVRGVDHLTAADVDPHVAEPVEEDEVAGLELVARDRRPHCVEGVRAMRQGHADLGEDVHDEAGAVESARA